MNNLAAFARPPCLLQTRKPLVLKTCVFNSSILSFFSLLPLLHLLIFFPLLLIFSVDTMRFSHFFVSFPLQRIPNAVPFNLINNNSDFFLMIFVIQLFSDVYSTCKFGLQLHMQKRTSTWCSFGTFVILLFLISSCMTII